MENQTNPVNPVGNMSHASAQQPPNPLPAGMPPGSVMPNLPWGIENRPFYKKWWFVLIVILVCLAVAAGLVFGFLVVIEGKTKWGIQLQDYIWEKSITSTESVKETAVISYLDSGSYTFDPAKISSDFGLPVTESEKAEMKNYVFALDKPGYSLTIDGFFEIMDPKSLLADFKMESKFSNNSNDYIAYFDAKMKGVESFFRFDYNDTIEEQLTKLFDKDLDEVEKYRNKWIRVKQSALADLESRDSVKKSPDENLVVEQQTRFRDALKNNRLVSIESFKGISQINNHVVLHYGLSFDKAKLRNVLVELYKSSAAIQGMSHTVDNASLQDAYEKILDAFLDRVEVRKYEVWVGVLDGKIYKSELESNAVSLTKTLDLMFDKDKSPLKGVFKTFGGANQASALRTRDTVRVSHIRQYQSALEVYHDEYGGYPVGSKGVPVLGDVLKDPLTAPTPPDGKCNDFFNTYWYEPAGASWVSDQDGKTKLYPSYKLTFCLGVGAGSYPAGAMVATPETGILSGSEKDQIAACGKGGCGYELESAEMVSPESDLSGIPSSEKELVDMVVSVVKVLPFDATFSVKSEVEDFGKTKAIQFPDDYIDPFDDGSGNAEKIKQSARKVFDSIAAYVAGDGGSVAGSSTFEFLK